MTDLGQVAPTGMLFAEGCPVRGIRKAGSSRRLSGCRRNPARTAGQRAERENCKVRGLVHFSVIAAYYSQQMSTENMYLTPSLRTLQFSCRAETVSGLGSRSGLD